MSQWTEASLRAAASWQAFKEGQSLVGTGAVSEARATEDGWQGIVRAGAKRALRVKVIAKSPSYFEACCGCPENQASGELCAHAIAAGLAIVRGVQCGPAASIAPEADGVAGVEAGVAYQVDLPRNWALALSKGKLSASIRPVSEATPWPADEALGCWMSDVKATAPIHLHLDGDRAAGLLGALIGHPRVAVDGQALQVQSGGRIALDDAALDGDRVRLLLSPGQVWVRLGEKDLWNVAAAGLTRAGSGPIADTVLRPIAALLQASSQLVAVPQILEELDLWQDCVLFPDDCWLETVHFVPASVKVQLALEGSLERLEARLRVAYGESSPVIPDEGVVPGLPRLVGGSCEVRERSAERAAVRRLEQSGFQMAGPGNWVLDGEPAILAFLTRDLPKLRDDWQITEGARFERAHASLTVMSPRIDVTGSGEDWLSFELSFETNAGLRVSAADMGQWLRPGKNARGRRVLVAPEFGELVEPLLAELDVTQRDGAYHAGIRAGAVIKELQRQLCHGREDLASESMSVPPGIRASLRPYQAAGAAWLQRCLGGLGGAVLADDMGLGKTLQAIVWVESLLLAPTAPVLVVAPTSLLGNWRAEFGRFAPERRVRVMHGSGREDRRDGVEAGEVLLTSYGTLARDLAWHLRQDYQAVVVDEASFLRNPDTDHAKALRKLRTVNRLALTGTPIENGVRDLWSIFQFVQPGWLGGREAFRERYELPLAAGEAGVLERLKIKVKPFMLRRTKEQVAPELPSKLLIDEYCDLSSDQQSLYRQLLDDGRKRVDSLRDQKQAGAARMQMLTVLLRLRQVCCDLALLDAERWRRLVLARRSAKLQRLLELLDEAISGGHRVLVFSQFQKQLLEIEKCLAERGWDSLRLDGQTRERQAMVDRFQALGGPPVFLISLKAGGYGLNLTAADTVVHFDPWWNPAAEMQATDRAHRIGQTRPVTVYRLLTRGTVEEKVLRLQARKRALAAAIDEVGAGDAAGWSMADLEEVLRIG